MMAHLNVGLNDLRVMRFDECKELVGMHIDENINNEMMRAALAGVEVDKIEKYQNYKSRKIKMRAAREEMQKKGAELMPEDINAVMKEWRATD